MKGLIFGILTTLTLNLSAMPYTAVVICGERDLVLDKGQEGRGGQAGQIVLKNQEIINYFLETGAIDNAEINHKGELIVSGVIQNQTTFTKGGNIIGKKGFLFKKVENGYFLEVYVNNYPQYDTVASFTFNNCQKL